MKSGMRRYEVDVELARTLLERRIALGLTRRELALLSGLYDETIARYERAQGGIPPAARGALEQALEAAERGGPRPPKLASPLGRRPRALGEKKGWTAPQ